MDVGGRTGEEEQARVRGHSLNGVKRSSSVERERFGNVSTLGRRRAKGLAGCSERSQVLRKLWKVKHLRKAVSDGAAGCTASGRWAASERLRIGEAGEALLPGIGLAAYRAPFRPRLCLSTCGVSPWPIAGPAG